MLQGSSHYNRVKSSSLSLLINTSAFSASVFSALIVGLGGRKGIWSVKD